MDAPAREEGPTPDAAEELAQLTRGLRGHVRRRQRLGGEIASTPPAPVRRAPADASRAAAPATPEPAARTAPPARAISAAAREPASGGEARFATVDAGPAQGAADVRSQSAGARTLDELRRGVAQCRACSLCETRTNTVFLDGQGTSGVMFVGEAPGAEEDRTGVPFVGRAGQLLTDIVTKGMGLARQDVWIANVLKCRPPENRDPTPQEKATCTPWLDRQIEMLAPRILVPLGRHAAMHVLRVQASMNALRGRVHRIGGRPVVPTFHPAYLLRNPAEKKECWKDIQLAMKTAGLPIPGRGPDSASGS
jgi:DNA polymerase